MLDAGSATKDLAVRAPEQPPAKDLAQTRANIDAAKQRLAEAEEALNKQAAVGKAFLDRKQAVPKGVLASITNARKVVTARQNMVETLEAVLANANVALDRMLLFSGVKIAKQETDKAIQNTHPDMRLEDIDNMAESFEETREQHAALEDRAVELMNTISPDTEEDTKGTLDFLEAWGSGVDTEAGTGAGAGAGSEVGLGIDRGAPSAPGGLPVRTSTGAASGTPDPRDQALLDLFEPLKVPTHAVEPRFGRDVVPGAFPATDSTRGAAFGRASMAPPPLNPFDEYLDALPAPPAEKPVPRIGVSDAQA